MYRGNNFEKLFVDSIIFQTNFSPIVLYRVYVVSVFKCNRQISGQYLTVACDNWQLRQLLFFMPFVSFTFFYFLSFLNGEIQGNINHFLPKLLPYVYKMPLGYGLKQDLKFAKF